MLGYGEVAEKGGTLGFPPCHEDVSYDGKECNA